MSIDGIERLSLKRLTDLVAFAWANVPFYRKLWSSVGITPENIRSFVDFERLPMIETVMTFWNIARCLCPVIMIGGV